MTFEDLKLMRKGVHRMTKQDFRDSLKRSIDANEEYADGCWCLFMDSPMWYMTSRNPEIRGEDLLQTVMNKAREDDE